ncbi:D-alanyl-D-alanine carboxypeptidase family protein [Blastococcus goldschmidtiae]|uniref:Serine hydrolase n=1 Tax=Blastococcus goldschmidtiae TaxID=3075546 RepID=A0ABU2K4H3_9ACTN|nr:serine hydrolase [Blastococcus sp. DSM 46792]MDT0275056.1 serine hydrolase [Blastococcus sp. DSM 46792]
MGRRGGLRGPAAALLAAGLVVLPATAASGEAPRPTADPGAPTPSAPRTERPPQGSAPDGSTVGGEDLDTRRLVVADGTPPLPGPLAASGWLVADARSGAVLAARDPHGRYYPASTLKALTLLTLAPRLDPAQVVVGTPEDEQMEGSRVGLLAGGEYSVGLLLQGLVLQSGNDAANALARAAGGTEATVAAMTETAEAIGAYDTVVGGPSGLDVAGQSSSPYDLALIFRDLVEDPVTAALLTTSTAQVPEVPGRAPGFQIQNQNPLAGYPGTLGGKTGFTDAARHAFVTAAERDGRRLVVSVLDTENQPLRAADQAALLLDWGFAVPPGTDGVGRLVEPADLVESAEVAEPAEPAEVTEVTPSAGPAAGQPAAAVPPDPEEDAPPLLLGAALAVAAAGVVAATVVGRRRAVRYVSEADR